NKLVDLLGPSVDKVEDFDEDVEDYQLETNEEEVLSDWMILAGMDPNTSFNSFSDLGLHDANRNHDWFENVRQHYQNFNLADINIFIQQVCHNKANNTKNLVSDTIDFQTLNKN
ncbi:12745_t:CDS:1, partial [Racocetra persica]